MLCLSVALGICRLQVATVSASSFATRQQQLYRRDDTVDTAMPSELLCQGACTSTNKPPMPTAPQASVLAAKAFRAFPTGQVAPQGWLLDQLLLQANSLSGYCCARSFSE